MNNKGEMSMYMPQLIGKHAQEQPTHPATWCDERDWDYASFYKRMERVGAYFQQKGYKKGDIIALYALNSDFFLATYYGLQLAGFTVMPINTKLAAPEVQYIFDHSEAVALICDDKIKETIASLPNEFRDTLYIGGSDELGRVMEDESLKLEPVDLQGDDVAVVMYTSGTTGKPKGVMLTNQNILSVSEIWAEAMDIVKEDRLLISTPLFHCAASHVFVAPVIYKGGTTIVEEGFSKTSTIDLLQRMEPTIFFGVPAMYTIILNMPNIEKLDLSTLRLFAYGAAPMPYEVLKQLKRTFPKVRVQNMYGQTENSPAATTLKDEYALDKIGSVGQALPQTEVRVVGEHGESLPPGLVGEIVVRGPQIMKGYLRNERETNMAIRDGWLYSGDLGRFDEEGFLYIVDRKKDMLIRGGENVYPIEVEEVLYQIPEVLEAAVVGVPHPVYGEVPKAFVVLKEGKQSTEEAILNYCGEQLAKYKIPAEVEFMEELPRNASGKVLKHTLRS